MQGTGITIGMSGNAAEQVTSARLATALGSGDVAVYGTPAMIALMEKAAVAALSDALAPEYTSVGISLEVKHMAATPEGMTVTATARVTAVDGRVVTLEVMVEDEVEQIGVGSHQRAIVNRDRFQERADAKQVDR